MPLKINYSRLPTIKIGFALLGHVEHETNQRRKHNFNQEVSIMRKSIFILVATLMPVWGFAANRIYALKDTIAVPDTGTITIKMDNSVPVNGLNLIIQFDSTLIRFLNIKPAGRALAPNGVGSHLFAADKVSLIWYRPNAKQINAGSGRIFEITYVANDSLIKADTTTQLIFYQGLVADSNLAVIPFEYINGSIRIKYEGPVAVENRPTLPTRFEIFQNYPNPFNPTTTIRYALPMLSDLSLKVYDLMGREVTTLVDEIQSAGFKTVLWNATDHNGRQVATGVYFYRLEATRIGSKKPSFVQVRRMLLVK